MNRILLGLAGDAIASRTGVADGRWATYRQAAAEGWQVRGGERGTGIVKLVDLGRGGDGPERSEESGGGRETEPEGPRRFALRRYVVFNAAQMDGIPELEAGSGGRLDPASRAEAIVEAMKAKTGLKVVLGGDSAHYAPLWDEIRMPRRKAFLDDQSFRLCALHESAHATLHPRRLNRRDALGERWGDEAYAMEELRAEMCSAFCAAEIAAGSGSAQTLAMDPAHVERHGAYLRSWVKAIRGDPMAIFTAAKDAELMADYMLGLEREVAALAPHAEWIAEYEQAERAR